MLGYGATQLFVGDCAITAGFSGVLLGSGGRRVIETRADGPRVGLKRKNSTRCMWL